MDDFIERRKKQIGKSCKIEELKKKEKEKRHKIMLPFVKGAFSDREFEFRHLLERARLTGEEIQKQRENSFKDLIEVDVDIEM